MGVSRSSGFSSENTITGIELIAELLGNLSTVCDDKISTNITSPISQVSDKAESARKQSFTARTSCNSCNKQSHLVANPMLGAHVRGQGFIRRKATCRSTITTHEGAAGEGAIRVGVRGGAYRLLIKHAGLIIESVHSDGPALMSDGSHPEGRVGAEVRDTGNTHVFTYYAVALHMFENKLKISQ